MNAPKGYPIKTASLADGRGKIKGQQNGFIYQSLSISPRWLTVPESDLKISGGQLQPGNLIHGTTVGPARVCKDLPLFDVVDFADLQQQQIRVVSLTDNRQQLQCVINEKVQRYSKNFKPEVERPELKQVPKINDVLPKRRTRLRL